MGIRYLTSDRAKHSFLTTFIERAERDETEGRLDIQGGMLNRARNLQTQFNDTSLQIQEGFADRMAAVADLEARYEVLKQTVRHFWSGLKNRAKRTKTNDWGVRKHRLHISKDIPKLSTRAEWLRAATELTEGEALAVAGGAEPMSNPGAADIVAAVDAAKAAQNTVGDRRRDLQVYRQAFNAAREEVAKLYREAARYFRFSRGEINAAERREIMRDYGYIFTTNLSESGGEGTAEGTETTSGEGSETGGETGSEAGSGGSGSGESETGTETGSGSGNGTETGEGSGAETGEAAATQAG